MNDQPRVADQALIKTTFIMSINPIKISVIEDLKDIAIELKNLLNEYEDLSCTQVYHNAEDAITFLPQNPADVVIVDIGLPGASGIQAIITLKEMMPNAQFCMFTVFEDDAKIFQSIQAGAKGYILKNESSHKIIEAVRELYNGGSPMSSNIARKVIDSFTADRSKDASSTHQLPLTDREYELLTKLAEGLLYKEIAEKLGITIGTVKQHIHKIYHKLQVNNRTEAINRYLNRS